MPEIRWGIVIIFIIGMLIRIFVKKFLDVMSKDAQRLKIAQRHLEEISRWSLVQAINEQSKLMVETRVRIDRLVEAAQIPPQPVIDDLMQQHLQIEADTKRKGLPDRLALPGTDEEKFLRLSEERPYVIFQHVEDTHDA